jgi:hypothetical protein
MEELSNGIPNAHNNNISSESLPIKSIPDIDKNNINDINLIEKERNNNKFNNNNNFIFEPKLHRKLPPNLYNNDKSKNSFIFTHIVKKTKVFKKTLDALDKLRERQSVYKGLEVQRNIPYTSSNLDKQKLDLYLPPNESNEKLTNLPVVIHFHGGGWVRGDRIDEFRGTPAICRQYSNNGIIAIAPSYRLSTSEHMQDAVDVILWVVQNSINIGANPGAIFISGHSAGTVVNIFSLRLFQIFFY